MIEHVEKTKIFESSNYFNHPVVFKNFENYTDPHSDYFGALANYGIFGFTLLLAIPIYMVVYYFRNIKNIKLHKDSLIYFLIILMILIEAIIVDILPDLMINQPQNRKS